MDRQRLAEYMTRLHAKLGAGHHEKRAELLRRLPKIYPAADTASPRTLWHLLRSWLVHRRLAIGIAGAVFLMLAVVLLRPGEAISLEAAVNRLANAPRLHVQGFRSAQTGFSGQGTAQLEPFEMIIERPYRFWVRRGGWDASPTGYLREEGTIGSAYIKVDNLRKLITIQRQDEVWTELTVARAIQYEVIRGLHLSPPSIYTYRGIEQINGTTHRRFEGALEAERGIALRHVVWLDEDGRTPVGMSVERRENGELQWAQTFTRIDTTSTPNIPELASAYPGYSVTYEKERQPFGALLKDAPSAGGRPFYAPLAFRVGSRNLIYCWGTNGPIESDMIEARLLTEEGTTLPMVVRNQLVVTVGDVNWNWISIEVPNVDFAPVDLRTRLEGIGLTLKTASGTLSVAAPVLNVGDATIERAFWAFSQFAEQPHQIVEQLNSMLGK